MRKMFSVMALSLSCTVGLQAATELSPAVKEDLHVILDKGLLNSQYSRQMFEGLAQWVLMDEGADTNAAELVDQLFVRLSQEDGKLPLMQPYLEHFSADEIHALSEIVQNPVMDKLTGMTAELAQTQAEYLRTVMIEALRDSGQSRAAISAAAEGQTFAVTDETFSAEVEQAGQPVVLDVYASWCPPCRKLAPIVEELSGEQSDYKFAKIDADANAATVEKLNVQGLPTLIFMKDGKELGRLTGFNEKSAIEAKLKELFS